MIKEDEFLQRWKRCMKFVEERKKKSWEEEMFLRRLSGEFEAQSLTRSPDTATESVEVPGAHFSLTMTVA